MEREPPECVQAQRAPTSWGSELERLGEDEGRVREAIGFEALVVQGAVARIGIARQGRDICGQPRLGDC